MGTNIFSDRQLAKAFYLRQMAGMKALLNFGEIKFGGRDDSQYKLFKKTVMDEYYLGLADVFDALVESSLLQKCSCGTNIRKGYKENCVKCNGAGYCNTSSFDDSLCSFLPEENIGNRK